MNNILLIDADPFMYMDGHKESIEEAINSINNRLVVMLEDLQSTEFVMAFSVSRTFRHIMHPVYKANRATLEKPPLFNDIKDYFEENFEVMKAPMLEADDIVSVLSGLIENSTVCSIDKDVLHQVVGENYDFKYRKDKEDNLVVGRRIKTDHDDAAMFLYKQILMGDSTDNIQGIKGVGEKKAEKILEEGIDRALPTYVDKFGIIEGTRKFNETFNLVYIKRKLDELPEVSAKAFESIPVMEIVNVDGEETFFQPSRTILL